MQTRRVLGWATAEVIVRERRLIDLALDPFRQIAG